MPKFHLADSGLGGMGKSLFTQILIHLHEEMKIPYAAFDADTEARTVSDRYPHVTQLLEISDANFRNTDIVYERMEMGETVLVDLPTGAAQSVQNWFERDDLFRLTKELRRYSDQLDYQFVHWFLSDVSPASINKFHASVDYYQERMEHVFVRNLGKIRARDWERFLHSDDMNELRSLLVLDSVSQVIFPRFVQPYGFAQSNLTFAEALSTVSKDKPRLFVLDRQKVATFIKHTRQELARTTLLDHV